MKSTLLQRTAFALVVVAFLFGAASSVTAQQLPLRHYGVPDGLPHSSVRSIIQDSRGYIWIGTAEGLAQFDGYSFKSYDTTDGLANSYINSLAEDKQGRIWVSTNGGGIAYLSDQGAQSDSSAKLPVAAAQHRFVSLKLSDDPAANRVNASLFDAAGNLWCLTDAGLYRASVPTGRFDHLEFELLSDHDQELLAIGALADTRGRLWFGNGDKLLEEDHGRLFTYGPGKEFEIEIRSLVEDHQGRILAATDNSLLQYIEPSGDGPRTWKPFPLAVALQGAICTAVDSKGALWIGTANGLVKYDGTQIVLYNSSNGLSDSRITALLWDRDGNMWIGTDGGGVCLLAAEPAIGIGRAEGLPDQPVTKVFQDNDGRVYASVLGKGLFLITDSKAIPIKWSQMPVFNGMNLKIERDPLGDWWVGTDDGLYLFKGPDLLHAHGRRFTDPGGGPHGVVGEMYRDPHGRIWFGDLVKDLYCIDRSAPQSNGPLRKVPTTDRFHCRRFVADRTGALWIGGQFELTRFSNGEFVRVHPGEGLPSTEPRALYLDNRGWLWVGLRNNGVSVCKDPSAPDLTFTNYSAANGLASSTVWTITGDDSGHIYLGTGKGLDWLDPETGVIKHITAGQMFSGDLLVNSMKDNHGNIWISTTSGLIRFDPAAELAADRPPPIYLTKLRIAGAERTLPEVGIVHGPSLTLGPSDNNLLIEYVGLDFQSDRALKYQYKLEGVDHDWSAPTDQRSVNYASLAPGNYKFMVQAISPQGIVSPEPAVIDFRILPPVWRRWWFLLASGVAIALIAYGLHRYRLGRLIEMLSVRSRIASDLHDDIGANLTRIAILSEVANQQLGAQASKNGNPLTAIARISRESVASMSDIVWAIDPRKDTNTDLVRRIRQFAIDMLGGAGIGVAIKVTGDEQSNHLGPDFRRQVFLVFKEAVNNAARHSGCSKVEVEVGMNRKGLSLVVFDNGRGFDPDRDYEGQGLNGMQRRANALGGNVEVLSGAQGTRVMLWAPWARQTLRSFWAGNGSD